MSSNQDMIKNLKDLLKENNIEYSKIMMFGSRVRNDFIDDSDWDFLIIMKNTLTINKKKDLWLLIYKKFHERVPLASIDLILKDLETYEKEKTIANTISNEVYLEGVEV